jgi:hypothetical protein
MIQELRLAVNRAGLDPASLPNSTPQIVVRAMRGKAEIVMIFRDSERGDRVFIAMPSDPASGTWAISI